MNSNREPALESLWCIKVLACRDYLRVGDLSIIVNHSFTALMLFVHLHTV
jgi:hypothetical protein